MASKKKPRSAWPGIRCALEVAQLSLAAPPGAWLISVTKAKRTRESLAKRVRFIERQEPIDSDPSLLMLRAVLPIEWCPNNNVLVRAHIGTKTSLSKKIAESIFVQNRCKKPEAPLGGRPLVRFVQFSVRDPDEDCSFTKVPLDVLTTGRRGGGKLRRHRLGFIEDDNRIAIDLRAWWEPAPVDAQFIYFEIWDDQ